MSDSGSDDALFLGSVIFLAIFCIFIFFHCLLLVCLKPSMLCWVVKTVWNQVSHTLLLSVSRRGLD